MSLRYSTEQSAAGKKLIDNKKLPAQLTKLPTLAISTDAELGEKMTDFFPRKQDAISHNGLS
jgi:hypothetical protein